MTNLTESMRNLMDNLNEEDIKSLLKDAVENAEWSMKLDGEGDSAFYGLVEKINEIISILDNRR